MKVTEALGKGSPTLSFEFFPPRTQEQEEHLYQVIAQLKEFRPDFVSVTYGAMGTTRERSFFWAKEIKDKFQIEPVAHLTCVAATRDEISQQIDYLEKIGVENILALRGDPPEDQEKFESPPNGFNFAKELIAFIKKKKPNFCLGAAGYPEGHRESPSLEKDIRYLKEKIGAGAEYIISQLFFENRHFFAFVERCQKAGLKVPIIPGIMPITSLSQIKKMTRICGATIPPKLLEQLETKAENKKAVQQIGIEQAVSQCQELLRAKVPGLHFFAMNQAEPISQILKQLPSLRR